MHLEHDLEIRIAAGSTLPSDIAIGVGDGWHQLVKRALVDIREVSAGHVFVRQIKEKLGALTIHTDVARSGLSDDIVHQVFRVSAAASEASETVCEMCGVQGRLTKEIPYRVRCDGCEADETRRQAVWGRYRSEISEACRYYVSACVELGRLLPVEEVVMQVSPAEKEHKFFLDEVHDRLCWYRAGSWIDGVEEGMRNRFWRLRF